MRRAPKPPLALTPINEEKLAAEQLQRQQAAQQRMAWHDRLPPALREIANGLPVAHQDLLAAIEAGCTTQEEAEEWFRSIVGRTVLG
jgi:hypothetical protein